MKTRLIVSLAVLATLGLVAARPLAPMPAIAGDDKPLGAGETMLREVPGVSAVALARETDALFNEEQFAETRAVLILKDGQPVFERYAEGYGPDTRFISWSMAKSVTSVLVGMMVADGRLALDDPAPVPAWQRPGDPRGTITLRQLLHMASGLQHTEAGDPPYQSDEVRMLFLDGREDMAAYAEGQPLEAEPGTQFEYSTNTSVILADILTRQLTDSEDPDERRRAMLEFMRGRLIEPLGLTSMVPEFDASGTLIGGSIIQASARDWARFGEFLRNRGVVNGARLLPESWFDFMLSPSALDPAYGGHIWLNRRRPEGRGTVLFPDQGPPSVFACLGHLGQFVVVSPQQGVVIVRLGMTPDPVLDPVHAQLGRVLALFPRS